MIEDCESKGYPKPKWESKLGSATLIFPDVTVTAKTDDAVNDEITTTVKLRLIEMVNFISKNKGTKVIDLVTHFNV